MSQPNANLEITGNESIEELEALLDALEDGMADESQPEPSQHIEQPEPSSVEQPSKADSEDAGSATAHESSNGEEHADIASKDGKHTIPFEVLQRERESNAQLQARIAQLEQLAEQSSKATRLVEVRNKQLEKLGVEPEDLPEDFKVTEEKLEELSEDYPELAGVIRYLVDKVDRTQGTAPTATSTQPETPTQTQQPDPVQAAIAAVPELQQMVQSGGEDWQRAQDVDDQLRSDPQWQSKPLQERFAEVARIVTQEKQARSKQVAEQATQQAVEQASSQLPNSPSEVGSTSNHHPSPAEFLSSDVTAEQLMDKFATMSPDEIDAYLAAGGI